MDEWKRTLILTNAVLSFFTNLILLYFIARHSRRHISGYKFLLAIFALFNICFAVTQATVLPDYMQFSMLNEYGLDSETTPMLGPIYFVIRQSGRNPTHELAVLSGLFLLYFATACFSTILYCSRKIDAVLSKSRMSERARRLQKDLFKALLIQLIVPGISKFLPGTCMFTFPLFGLNTGKLANYAAVLASFNTVLEPIFLLYFVKDYRYAILRMAGKRDSSGTYYISETGEKIERSLTYAQKPISPRTATML
ncbi:unnamed protein product, partial [Mesorhabditis spiculigera]